MRLKLRGWIDRLANELREHISPDIVSAAIESCQSVYGEDLKLELHKVDECRGIACILPRSRVADSQLPLFEGGVIPDEDRLGMDAFLLASPKSMSDGMRFRQKIREVCACRNGRNRGLSPSGRCNRRLHIGTPATRAR